MQNFRRGTGEIQINHIVTDFVQALCGASHNFGVGAHNLRADWMFIVAGQEYRLFQNFWAKDDFCEHYAGES